jgi:hypothetical protein
VLRWSWFIFNTSSSLVYNVRSRSKQLLLTSASLQQTKPGIVSRAMLSTTGTVPIKFQTPSRPQMFVVLLYKNELEGGKHSGTEGVFVSITTFKEKCVPYLFTYYFELRGIQVCECQGGWCWWLRNSQSTTGLFALESGWVILFPFVIHPTMSLVINLYSAPIKPHSTNCFLVSNVSQPGMFITFWIVLVTTGSSWAINNFLWCYWLQPVVLIDIGSTYSHGCAFSTWKW